MSIVVYRTRAKISTGFEDRMRKFVFSINFIFVVKYYC